MIPYVAGSFWFDRGAFFRCRQRIRELNDKVHFDAIISFDLLGAGGIAWRARQDLGIPTCGWATGDDVLIPPSPAYARVVIRALERLDLVFYQSQELMAKAAGLLGTTLGIACRTSDIWYFLEVFRLPLYWLGARSAVESVPELGLSEDQVLVVNIGRISREKAVLELVDAFSMADRPKSPRGLPAHRFDFQLLTTATP